MLGRESHGIALGDQGDSWSFTQAVYEDLPLPDTRRPTAPVFITLKRFDNKPVTLNVAHIESFFGEDGHHTRLFTYGDRSVIKERELFYTIIETPAEIRELINKERELIRRITEL